MLTGPDKAIANLQERVCARAQEIARLKGEEGELANQFASPDLNKSSKNTYGRAEKIGDMQNAISAELDAMMPDLDCIQSVWSERGEERRLHGKPDLPKDFPQSWSTWWEWVRRETGIRMTLRAIEKRLQKYRGQSTPRSSSPSRRLQVVSENQKILKFYSRELADSLESGDATVECLERLKTAIEDELTTTRAVHHKVEVVAEPDEENTDSEDHDEWQRNSTPETLPEPADVNALLKILERTSGPAFRATFADLDGHRTGKSWERLIVGLDTLFADYDRMAGALTAKVIFQERDGAGIHRVA